MICEYGVKNNYIFGILSPTLPVYYTAHILKAKRPNFMKFSTLLAVQSSSDESAMCYVFSVLCMMTCIHMEGIGQNQKRHVRTVCFVEFFGWRHRGEVCRLRLHLVCILRLLSYWTNEYFSDHARAVIVSLLRPSRDTKYCDLCACMYVCGLRQHVTGPTHASGNTLDLILSHDGEIS